MDRANITQLELLPAPPEERSEKNPWPEWPLIYRVSSSHEEAIHEVRDFCVMTKKFSGENGQVKKAHCVRIEWENNSNTGRKQPKEVNGSEFEIEADMVLLAMGFAHPIHKGLVEQLGVKLDRRGNVSCDHKKMTSALGVFVAGDMTRGQSLVVWAIAEGREAARAIDEHLMGSTILPHSEFL